MPEEYQPSSGNVEDQSLHDHIEEVCDTAADADLKANVFLLARKRCETYCKKAALRVETIMNGYEQYNEIGRCKQRLEDSAKGESIW